MRVGRGAGVRGWVRVGKGVGWNKGHRVRGGDYWVIV